MASSIMELKSWCYRRHMSLISDLGLRLGFMVSVREKPF